MAHVLIADADEGGTTAAGAWLARTAGHSVARAREADEARTLAAARRPDVVLVGASLAAADTPDLVADLAPVAPVLVLLDGGAGPGAAALMARGAEGVVTLPAEPAALGAIVERAVEKARLRRAVRQAPHRGQGASTICGPSAAMRELAQQVAMLAASDRTTVLLVGETGTGKGRLAEQLHLGGPLGARPFVEVNCAALAPDALDRALFGVVRAEEGVPGLVEAADGGTLFLDEIGDLPAPLQPKVLRLLEGKSVRRVGGTHEVTARVRVIAATQRDLVNEVTAGRFREDLYYRLSVMPVHLPPLRARSGEDLAELVAAVLHELGGELPLAPRRLADGALERLLAWSWPGNVRELRNVLERAMLLGRGGDRIGVELFPPELRAAAGDTAERHVPRTLEDVERAHIERTLDAHAGNRTHASRELGISRATLIKKIKDYGL